MLRKWWPLLVLLVFQFGSLIAMSQRSASALFSDMEIQLRTEAFDPFDPLAGRFVTLRYAVEDTLEGDLEDFEEGEFVWLHVERASPAWVGVSVTREWIAPTEDLVSLRVQWQGRPVIPNTGRLYMAEELCLEADELLADAPSDGIVTLRVDDDGNATPIQLEIKGRVFP